MNTIHIEIGNRIRQLRLNKGFSHEKLTELSTAHIGHIDNTQLEKFYSVAKILAENIDKL